MHDCLLLATGGARGLIMAPNESRSGILLSILNAQPSPHGRESSDPKGQGWIDPKHLCQWHQGKCSASFSEALTCLCDLRNQMYLEMSKAQPLEDPASAICGRPEWQNGSAPRRSAWQASSTLGWGLSWAVWARTCRPSGCFSNI